MDWPRVRAPGVGGSLWFSASAALVGLVGFLTFQWNPFDQLLSETHCYQSVRTHSEAAPYVNCFSVTSSGTFSRVFHAPSGSSLADNESPGFVIPGLWDGHGHLLQYGEFLNSVDLFGSSSLEDVLGRVEVYVNRSYSRFSSFPAFRLKGAPKHAPRSPLLGKH